MMHQDSSEPTGVSDDSSRGGSAVARARDRKAHAAIQLRKAGADWAEVAEVIGYPTPRAALVAVENSLEKELKTEEGQKFMRTLAGQRLDRLLRSVWSKAVNPEHPDHLPAVDRARQIIDRHARLYGLDAPAEYVVHSPTQVELEKWVTRVVTASVPVLEEADIFEAEVINVEDEPDAASAQ